MSLQLTYGKERQRGSRVAWNEQKAEETKEENGHERTCPVNTLKKPRQGQMIPGVEKARCLWSPSLSQLMSAIMMVSLSPGVLLIHPSLSKPSQAPPEGVHGLPRVCLSGMGMECVQLSFLLHAYISTTKRSTISVFASHANFSVIFHSKAYIWSSSR